MEFSRENLETIQRAAELLGLSVDELLQQSRKKAKKDANIPSLHDSPGTGPQHNSTQQTPSEHPLGLTPDSEQQTPFYASSDQDKPHELALTPPPSQCPDTEVILLNPHTVLYGCDAPFWSSGSPTGQGFEFDDGVAVDPLCPEDEPSVQAMEWENDVESGFEPIDVEDRQSMPDNSPTSWSMVSAPSGSAARRISASSGSSSDRRYPQIAPKSVKTISSNISASSANRIKKKRSGYTDSKRRDTYLTRQFHACIRCRMQRNRVRPCLVSLSH